VVRLLLAAHARRTVLRREEVVKKVLTATHAKAFAAVLSRAALVVRRLFGLDVRALPPKTGKPSKPNSGAAATPAAPTASTARLDFVLVDVADKPDAAAAPRHLAAFAAARLSDRALPRSSLLCIVLSLVLAEKRAICAAALYKHLEVLAIYRTRVHPVFGNIDDLLSSFVKEEYLDKLKPDPADAAQNNLSHNSKTAGNSLDIYMWGARAKVEFSESEIIAFVQKMFPPDEAENVHAILSQVV
ncbi:hypothetical protein HK100_003460, partial [Physocladia obscura]